MRNRKRKPFWIIRTLLHRLFVVVGAVGLTLTFFLVLPLMQALTKPPSTDMMVMAMDTAIEPPPAPAKPEPEPEPEEEDTPPELEADTTPLTLEQLTVALNPSFGEGLLAGDFAVSLNTVTSDSKDIDKLFSISELDQKPRAIYQPGPMLTKDVRKKAPGTVYIIFIVDQNGRVQNPTVQKSTDPVFDKPALTAIKKWKFEPGKRNGKPVRFRMRVPFTFPKG